MKTLTVLQVIANLISVVATNPELGTLPLVVTNSDAVDEFVDYISIDSKPAEAIDDSELGLDTTVRILVINTTREEVL